MPESRPVSVPHGLGSVVDIVRRENRLDTYREYHKSVQAHSAVELASLHEQCQLQTERLRERLVTTKAKKKRPNAGGGSGAAGGDQRKDGTPLSQPAQSPASESVSLKRPLEVADRVAPTKQPKRDPESDLRLLPPGAPPAYSCPAVTTASSSPAALQPSGGGPSGLIDDLFGDVSGDIDYEHVLQQLTAGDPAGPPGGASVSAGHSSSSEIPDMGDLSCWIEGAERGVDVSFPEGTSPTPTPDCKTLPAVASTAATMLRNMADRLSSGGGGTAAASPPAAVKQEQLPAATAGPGCEAGSLMVAAAEPPKLTMEQRLRLKRQMMAEEFRQAHLKQQTEQSMSASSMVHQQRSAPSMVHHQTSASSMVHQQTSAHMVPQQSSAPMVHRQTSVPSMVHHQTSASMVHQQTSASSMVHQQTSAPSVHQQSAVSMIHQQSGLSMVHQQTPGSMLPSAPPASHMYDHQQRLLIQQQQQQQLILQQQQQLQQQRAAMLASQGGMMYPMVPSATVRHPQRFMVGGDPRMVMVNHSAVSMDQSFPPAPLQHVVPRHVTPQQAMFAGGAVGPSGAATMAPIGPGMATTVPAYSTGVHPYH